MTTAATAPGTQREPELLGQTVVVIGGSAGIGLETAQRARAEGASVILTGRNPERLKASSARARRAAHRGLRRQRSGLPAVVLPGSPNRDRPRDGHRQRSPLQPSPRNAAGGGVGRMTARFPRLRWFVGLYLASLAALALATFMIRAILSLLAGSP